MTLLWSTFLVPVTTIFCVSVFVFACVPCFPFYGSSTRCSVASSIEVSIVRGLVQVPSGHILQPSVAWECVVLVCCYILFCTVVGLVLKSQRDTCITLEEMSPQLLLLLVSSVLWSVAGALLCLSHTLRGNENVISRHPLGRSSGDSNPLSNMSENVPHLEKLIFSVVVRKLHAFFKEPFPRFFCISVGRLATQLMKSVVKKFTNGCPRRAHGRVVARLMSGILQRPRTWHIIGFWSHR